MSTRLLAICLALWATCIVACMDGGTKRRNTAGGSSNTSADTSQADDPGGKTAEDKPPSAKPSASRFESTVKNSVNYIASVKAPDGAPPEVVALAKAKTDMQRAKWVSETLKVTPPVRPSRLDPRDIRVGERGAMGFELRVIRVDDDSFAGSVNVGNFETRVYVVEGVDTATLATDQVVSFGGEWHAYRTVQRGLYTCVSLRKVSPIAPDPTPASDAAKADQHYSAANVEYYAKRTEYSAAKDRAEAEAMGTVRRLAHERFPLLPESEPINKRARAQRDHDEGLARLTKEAKAKHEQEWAEP